MAIDREKAAGCAGGLARLVHDQRGALARDPGAPATAALGEAQAAEAWAYLEDLAEALGGRRTPVGWPWDASRRFEGEVTCGELARAERWLQIVSHATGGHLEELTFACPEGQTPEGRLAALLDSGVAREPGDPAATGRILAEIQRLGRRCRLWRPPGGGGEANGA